MAKFLGLGERPAFNPLAELSATPAWAYTFLVIRFIGLALIGGEPWQSADDWAALFACALIGANGYRLLRPALYEIMDTAPGGKIVRSIRRAARSVPGVIEVEKCRVRKMGLDFYVDLHVGVKDSISVREGRAARSACGR